MLYKLYKYQNYYYILGITNKSDFYHVQMEMKGKD